jgi:ppGpp synthetase/RelA/SpoT-type nucleotidyltranferase
MTFPVPKFTKGQINRAGDTLIADEKPIFGIETSLMMSDEILAWRSSYVDAMTLINHWRACHAYPVNTFQATLRQRLHKIQPEALVATRLKRIPSIVQKLNKRTERGSMRLVRMQDIGGLRAVVKTVAEVNRLHARYTDGSLPHELIGTDDYIRNPKSTGYRSLHLIYRYKNAKAPAYDGLCIELQIRTALQHAWATAVETIGSFLKQALKANEGPEEWLDYFKVVGSAFAIMEGCPVAQEFTSCSQNEIFSKCVEGDKRLGVKRKLAAFTVATKAITTHTAKGNFHLIILDAVERNVEIKSFGLNRLDEANAAYADAEKVAIDHPDMQTVLVTSRSVKALRKAYPNYFLDTKAFLLALTKIERKHLSSGAVVGDAV